MNDALDDAIRTMLKNAVGDLDTRLEAGESLTVKKFGYNLPFSYDAAVALGLVSEDEARAAGWEPPPPPPPLPYRTRLRWWVHDRWDRRPRVHFGPCEHDWED